MGDCLLESTVWVFSGMATVREQFGTVWNSLEQLGTAWNSLEQLGTIDA
jgi:hypothetical protein